MIKCAVQIMRWQDTRAHRPHLYEKSMHTLCTIQWATAPGRSLNNPRPKSITHLRTFSDNGVYVALQLFSNSGIWPVTPGINTLLLLADDLGSFTCSGMTLPMYMGPTALRGIRATGDTLSNVESQVFTPYNFGSSRDRTPDLLTTRPTCYHSATALCTYMPNTDNS